MDGSTAGGDAPEPGVVAWACGLVHPEADRAPGDVIGRASAARRDLSGSRFGPVALGALRRALADVHPAVRLGALQALTRALEEPAARIGFLASPDDDERAARDAVPPVRAAMGDAHVRVRAAAARVLGALSASARSAIPAIFAVLDDPERLVRLGAAMGLSTLSERLARCVAFLPRGALAQRLTERGVHFAAAQLSGEVRERLRRATRDEDQAVRLIAARALGRDVPGDAARRAARESAHALIDALRMSNPELVPALVCALDDPDAELATVAARTLRRCGRAALSALAALRKCLGRSNEALTRECALLIGQLALADPGMTRPVLEFLLQAPARRPGPVAALAAAVTAVPDVLGLVTGALESSRTRALALAVLVRLDQRARPATGRLLGLLADPVLDPQPTCRALAAIDPLLGDVVPHLLGGIAYRLEGCPASRFQVVSRGGAVLVDRLIGTLAQPELDVRATWLIGRLAAELAQARPALEARYRRETRHKMLAWAFGPQRRYPTLVAWALERCPPPPPARGPVVVLVGPQRPEIERLRADLASEDDWTVWSALDRVAELDHRAASLVPDLIGLTDPPGRARGFSHAEHAVNVLGGLGPAAIPAILRLIAIVENGVCPDETNLLEEAIEALGRLGPLAGAALPLLCRLLDEASPRRCAMARWAIDRIVSAPGSARRGDTP